MTFAEFSRFIQEIEKTSSRLAITEFLAKLFRKLDKGEIGRAIYLLQGRVVPLYVHKEFGMAEKMVVKSVLRALMIDKKLFDLRMEKAGDVGKAVESFKEEIRSLNREDLSVSEVYRELERVASAGGDGSQEVKINILAGLIRQLDPLSSRYIARIPQAVMRLGFSDMTVLDALSWMIAGNKSLRSSIEHAYHVRPDLGFIAHELKTKGIKAISSVKPALFTPILMMRAERLSSGKEIIEKIGRCAVEPKYDGFRLQIHYKKSQGVKLFSRSLEDVSFMYPDIIEGVKKSVKADEIIFEGEAIGFDPRSGTFLPFQETVQRKRKYGIEEKVKEIPLRLFTFDLLFLNGRSHLNTSYEERRKHLERSIQSYHGKVVDTIVIASEQIVDEEKEIERLFDDAISKGLEGIIAKKLKGIYQPGARGWNWIKFKRSYASRISDTIDCLVMGYDFGKGKRTGFGIGAFLVGVYDDKKELFVTVAKIGTGLTDEEWKELQVQSSKFKVQSKPRQYSVGDAMACDVWVEPSIVVEIRADEITKSPVHTAHLALRFPRLERFRKDKRPEDATTLKEIERMFKKQVNNQ